MKVEPLELVNSRWCVTKYTTLNETEKHNLVTLWSDIKETLMTTFTRCQASPVSRPHTQVKRVWGLGMRLAPT